MLSKHNSIQRDQIEMITLDQLATGNHLVRKIESALNVTFINELADDKYSQMEKKHGMRWTTLRYLKKCLESKAPFS